MAINWGTAIWGNSGCGIRLGYEVSSVNYTSRVTTTMKVYFQTYYSLSIESNNLIIKFCGNEVYNKACSVQTSNNKSGWQDANIRQVWSGSTDNKTWSIESSFTTAWMGFSGKTAKISGSGTAWTQCGAPTNPTVTYNDSQRKFTINVTCGKDGTNNPVGGIEVYWKWDSTSVAYNNCSDKKINNSIKSQGSYSFEISNIPNTAKSIAVIAYTVDKITTDPNSAITYKTFNQILATFVHLPYRYYFSCGTKNGFKEKNDEIYNDEEVYKSDENYRYATDENYVSWEYTTPDKYKNYKRYFGIHIIEPGTNAWRSMGGFVNSNKLDLNNNKQAHIAALQCMQNSNCGFWNNGTTIPWAKYLDCEWTIENYIEANDTTKELRKSDNYYYPEGTNSIAYYYIGRTSFYTASDGNRNGRIELTTPPRNVDTTPNAIYQRNSNKEKCEDWGYESNKFDISWKPSMFANQYLLKYYVGVPNNSDNKSVNSVLLDKGWKYGYNETDKLNHYTLSIPSLLAGQQVWFSIIPRWYGEVIDGNQTYSYTYPATTAEATKIETATTRIQKQGGIIAVDENTGEYQNYHIYVVDKNGKPVKAKAAYIYTGETSDNSLSGWKLCKTITL